MDSEQEKEYRGLVRGAATYVLLGQSDPPMDACEIARIYNLDLSKVSADVDVIVQMERHKAGGVFETLVVA